jgi:general secretion pathway protein F
MPDFAYRVIDPAGREQAGRVSADSAAAARANLTARQLYVVTCDPAPAAAARAPLISLTRTRLNARDLALFTRQLATLTQVSPLEEALGTAARQSEAPHVRAIIATVQTGVREGRRLADAMAREPASFPALYRAMVAAGEASGSLPAILDRLADLGERQAEVRGKLTATLAYPVVLAIVAMVVVAALMIWVVPKVVEQFDTVGQQLPLLTRIVISLSASPRPSALLSICCASPRSASPPTAACCACR